MGTERKAKRKPPRSAFKPGNPYRWPKGVSGNPKGAGVHRPMLERWRAFYEANPEQIDKLLLAIHEGALGLRDLEHVQLLAYKEICRKLDLEHQTDAGKDLRPTLEEIRLVPDPARPPERAKVELPEGPTAPVEMPFDDGYPGPA
jgi:hypothetical protein